MKSILFVLVLALATAGPATGQERPLEEANGCPVVADWNAPARVSLAAVPDGLRISWMLPATAPTDVAGFQVVRAPDLNGPYTPVGLAERSVTEFVDTTAVPGTIYFYRIRAFQGGVCTPFSDPVFGQR